MLGAIIGDIVGSCYEFNGIKTTDFELFSPRSRYTDDSVMTMAVAEWLLDDPYHTHNILEEKMVKYGNLNTNVGYGSHFLHWLYFPQAKYEAKAKEYLAEKKRVKYYDFSGFCEQLDSNKSYLVVFDEINADAEMIYEKEKLYD
jgi:hypothetical protein